MLIKTYRSWKDYKGSSTPACAARAEMSRRRFLKYGVTGTASFFLPAGILSQLAAGKAEAALECPSSSSSAAGYVLFNPADGPVWNMLRPYDQNGDPYIGANLNNNAARWGVVPNAPSLRLGRGAAINITEHLMASFLQAPPGVPVALYRRVLRSVSFYGVGARSNDDGNGRQDGRNPLGLLQKLHTTTIPSDLCRNNFTTPVSFASPPQVLQAGTTVQSMKNAVGLNDGRTSQALMQATVDTTLRLADLFGFSREGKANGEKFHHEFGCGLKSTKTKVGDYGDVLFNPLRQGELVNSGIDFSQISDADLFVMMGSFRTFKGTFPSFTVGYNDVDEHQRSDALNISVRSSMGQQLAYAVTGAFLSGKPGMMAFASAGSANASGTVGTGQQRTITLPDGTVQTVNTFLASAQDDNGVESYGGVPRLVIDPQGEGPEVRCMGHWEASTGAYTQNGPLRGDIRLIALSDVITLARLAKIPLDPIIRIGIEAGLLRNTQEADLLCALV